MPSKEPKLNVAEIDQALQAQLVHVVPHYAAVFRAFLAEEGVDKREALELTVAYMNRPKAL